jgi:hypothetical protein
MAIEVDVSELHELANAIRQAGKASKQHMADVLAWGGEQFVGHMKTVVSEIRWTGTLESAIQVLESHDDYVVIGPDLGAAPHAQVVASGGSPHAAPYHKILNWVETKDGISYEGTAEEAAWEVWWSIKNRGTSMWAVYQGWGTSGEHPYARRTIELPAAKATLDKMTETLGERVIAEIVP